MPSSGEISQLMARGEELAQADEPAQALESFRAAWDALPQPKEEHEAVVGILAAIADCCFFLGRWNDCCDAVQEAFRCGADPANLFFRLRLGQSLYELGKHDEAANWLVPVYLMKGCEAFSLEAPKYLDYIRSQLKPPPGGWPEGW